MMLAIWLSSRLSGSGGGCAVDRVYKVTLQFYAQIRESGTLLKIEHGCRDLLFEKLEKIKRRG